MSIPGFRQRGTAAIELAVILTLGMTILATIVLFGRFTWHLIAMEKSVYNAARITAALPIEQLSGSAAGNTGARARNLFHAAALSSGIDIVPEVDSTLVLCNSLVCGATGINRVSVTTSTIFTDTVFSNEYTLGFLKIYEDTPFVFSTELDYVL